MTIELKLKPVYVAICAKGDQRYLIDSVGALDITLYMFNLEQPKRSFNFDKITNKQKI